jgi:hypothetical protein
MRRADHSSRGVLPSVVCLECYLNTSPMRRSRPTRAVEPWAKIKTVQVTLSKFSAAVQTGAAATQPTIQWVPGLSQG